MSSPSNNGPFVRDTYSRGGIQSKTELNTTGRMLSRIKFGHGIIGRAGPWGIEISATGTASFSGTAYAPNGVATTGLTDTTKPWLEFDEQNWSFSEIVGPPATPWAAYKQYRLKADLAGPWYANIN